MKKRTLTILIAVALVVVVAIGGTLAWLTDKTDPVTNTFTVGDIDIDLSETWNTDNNGDNINDSWTAQLVPGMNLTKDPVVTVKEGSEKCYLFVKVDESNWPQFKEDDEETLKVKYEIGNGWAQLNDDSGNAITGVYYRTVEASDSDQPFGVLKNNTVYVSQNLTKADLGQITQSPTLAFTAYAVKYMKDNNNSFTPSEAWENAQDATE